MKQRVLLSKNKFEFSEESSLSGVCLPSCPWRFLGKEFHADIYITINTVTCWDKTGAWLGYLLLKWPRSKKYQGNQRVLKTSCKWSCDLDCLGVFSTSLDPGLGTINKLISKVFFRAKSSWNVLWGQSANINAYYLLYHWFSNFSMYLNHGSIKI